MRLDLAEVEAARDRRTRDLEDFEADLDRRTRDLEDFAGLLLGTLDLEDEEADQDRRPRRDLEDEEPDQDRRTRRDLQVLAWVEGWGRFMKSVKNKVADPLFDSMDYALNRW